MQMHLVKKKEGVPTSQSCIRRTEKSSLSLSFNPKLCGSFHPSNTETTGLLAVPEKKDNCAFFLGQAFAVITELWGIQ